MDIEVQVGQEVAIEHSGYGFCEFGYVVTKISPTGRITVENATQDEEVVFSPDGRERGRTYYPRYLRTNVEELRKALHQKACIIKAAEAIRNVKVEYRVPDTVTKERLVEIIEELEAKLATAKKLVDEIQE